MNLRVSGLPSRRQTPSQEVRMIDMRTRTYGVLAAVAVVGMMPIAAQQRGGGPAPAPAMRRTVVGFPEGGQIPVNSTRAAGGAPPGEPTSPAIAWATAP